MQKDLFKSPVTMFKHVFIFEQNVNKSWSRKRLEILSYKTRQGNKTSSGIVIRHCPLYIMCVIFNWIVLFFLPDTIIKHVDDDNVFLLHTSQESEVL